jgi:hypothetical protein
VAANERHGGIVGRIIVVVVVIIADDEKTNRVRSRDIIMMFLRDDGGEGRGERVGLSFVTPGGPAPAGRISLFPADACGGGGFSDSKHRYLE